MLCRKLLKIVVFLLAVGMVSSSAMAMNVVMLDIDPAAQNYDLGESFEANLVISGLENTDLSSFNLYLGFDDTILDYESYMLGSGLGSDVIDISLGYNSNIPGIINLAGCIANTDQQDNNLLLATITFIGMDSGISELSIVDSVLTSTLGNAIDLYIAPNSGFVSVNHAPVPAAAWLLGSGLIGLIGIRRRFQK